MPVETDGSKIVIFILQLLGGIVLAFLVGSFGSFFALMFLGPKVWNEHDGQAGIGYAMLALIIGFVSAIITGIAVAVRFWRGYSAPEE